MAGGTSNGPRAVVLAELVPAGTAHPAAIPGEGQCRGLPAGLSLPLFLPLSSAPLWGLHGPWEHMGSVAQKLHTTQSSALLAFTGIIGEKNIIFPLLQQMPKAKNSFIKLLLY